MDLKKLSTIYLPHELTVCKFREYVADSNARAFRSGRDKSIVNPDPKGLYTNGKQQRSSTLSASSIEPSQGAWLFSIHFTAICLAIFVSNLCARLNSKIVSYCLTDISPVTYPDNGWSTSLTKMPMFTKAEMNEHITRSGKHISILFLIIIRYCDQLLN